MLNDSPSSAIQAQPSKETTAHPLFVAFRGLLTPTAEHGQLHEVVSVELHTHVAESFQGWTEKYGVCPVSPFPSPIINIDF